MQSNYSESDHSLASLSPLYGYYVRFSRTGQQLMSLRKIILRISARLEYSNVGADKVKYPMNSVASSSWGACVQSGAPSLKDMR